MWASMRTMWHGAPTHLDEAEEQNQAAEAANLGPDKVIADVIAKVLLNVGV